MSFSVRDIVAGKKVEAGAGLPLSHCRILWDNKVTADNIVASSERADFPAEALANPLTYDQWSPEEIPATLTVTFSSAIDVDSIAIGAHNLHLTATSVIIEYSTDLSTWEEYDTVAPSDGFPIMSTSQQPVTALAWRLRLVGGSIDDVNLKIGALFIGTALVMQRRMYGGHTPAPFSRDHTFISSGSERGQSLGRKVVREGTSTSFDFENLKAGWMREYFRPFYDHSMNGGYAFVAWYPEKFAGEVVYGAPDGFNISNQGTRDYMSASFSVRGIISV